MSKLGMQKIQLGYSGSLKEEEIERNCFKSKSPRTEEGDRRESNVLSSPGLHNEPVSPRRKRKSKKIKKNIEGEHWLVSHFRRKGKL